MASKNWESNLNLKDELLNHSRNFSFIQTFRLLSLLLNDESNNKSEPKTAAEYIRVRPELSLEFPVSDVATVKNVKLTNKEIYQITATFLGIYGTSSPLPTFYTENLFRDQAEDNFLNREFVDIFNNHLYQIFFEIWSKHRLSYQLFEKQNIKYLNYLYSLSGLSDPNTIKIIPKQYNPLRYLSLLGHLPKTSYWLKILLIDLLKTNSIEIHECIDTVISIPEDQRLALGSNNNILGDTTHLGEQIISTNHAFLIQIGPISYSEYKTLMPRTPKFQLINQIVSLYVDSPLVWNIEFIVSKDNNMGIRLGIDNNSHLGYDAWVFSFKEEKVEQLEYKVCFKNNTCNNTLN